MPQALSDRLHRTSDAIVAFGPVLPIIANAKAVKQAVRSLDQLLGGTCGEPADPARHLTSWCQAPPRRGHGWFDADGLVTITEQRAAFVRMGSRPVAAPGSSTDATDVAIEPQVRKATPEDHH